MQNIVLLLLTVAVAQASVSVTRTSSPDMHPSAMEIEVQLPDSNKKIRIPLTKTDDFENIPVTVAENGVSRTFSSHQIHHASHAHYRDVETKSVISVRHVNGQRRISGHVMHEGTSYFLEPLGESAHSVTKKFQDLEAMAKKLSIDREIETRRKRQTNDDWTTYKIELYLLLDSRVWDEFKQVYSTDSAALTELHFYYTHILNGIDTAYRNIGTPSISVRCIGMTISKTLADDTWMAGEDTEGSNILTAMTRYIVGKTADHFMAFTRMDISGSGSFSVCGMAYVGGVCKSTKVSINEDQGLHSWGTAAHELAHNLGSRHDGSNNQCSSTSKYLMSPVGGIYSLADVANSYRFSSCSVSYIYQNLNTLGSSNCMTSDQGSRLMDLTTRIKAGIRMTLDQVCKLAMPNSPGKLFVSSEFYSNPALICAKILCTVSAGSGTTSSGLRAPVGTPCGSQKSCDWNGQCTADSQVPVIDMSCFFGDKASAEQCQSFYETIAAAPTASIRQNYCGQVFSACCKTLAPLCS